MPSTSEPFHIFVYNLWADYHMRPVHQRARARTFLHYRDGLIKMSDGGMSGHCPRRAGRWVSGKTWRHGDTFELLGSKSIKVCSLTAQVAWTLDCSEKRAPEPAGNKHGGQTCAISFDSTRSTTVALPARRGHRYVRQLTVGQTPGSDSVPEHSVHPASVWLHRLPPRPGSRWPVDERMEPHLHSTRGVRLQLPGVEPQRRPGELHRGGAERHAHRRRRGVVQPVQLSVCAGNVQLQEESAGTRQSVHSR